MNNGTPSTLRLAVPSKGALEKPTLDLLAASGLRVSRPNERQYVGSIPALPHVTVLFQRAADIFTKVQEGSVDLGITGYDVVREDGEGHADVLVVYGKLGFGKCELVLAVPDSWVDISSMEDLADLTLYFKEKGRDLRIVTKYSNLTRNFLYNRRVIHFSLVEAKGALEAAPSMGYADMIADVTSTGTTLRENRLKQISGGTILSSQACLIGNKRLLQDPGKLHLTRLILESIEAHLEAKKYASITANIRGQSAEDVTHCLVNQPELLQLAGLRGPTVAKVYARDDAQWYAVTIIVKQHDLLRAVDHLRQAGGTDIAVFSPDYIFGAQSDTFQQLLTTLNSDSSHPASRSLLSLPR
ncbi:ATP phosphoribosyltransferase [Neosynechococcus sphagnicola]|uniref:ATP phosphoribosyltransferase n=1 Tax=Neosynechococcus sphagnicola TaxID=1501145 RepID=UPI0006893050|nr:ATP phosphoribosyltransferase [Neosynechococcus sphagnicola]